MQPSRRDAIRALRRGETLCPALICGHTPGDGRQTIRLTAKGKELKDVPIIGDRDFWQRSDRRVDLSLQAEVFKVNQINSIKIV